MAGLIGWMGRVMAEVAAKDDLGSVETDIVERPIEDVVPPPVHASSLTPFEGKKRTYYKLVAQQNGRYYSIYDGVTEYYVGKTLSQPVRPGHRGGYYVCETLYDLLKLNIPTNSELKRAEWAVARVEGWGSTIVYSAHKIAVQSITVLGFRPFPYDKRSFFRRKAKTRPAALPRPQRGSSGIPPDRIERAPDLPGISLTRDNAVHQDRLARRRAETMTLEDEIFQMEENLAAIRAARGQ
mmetsp:Transcript_16153/g.38053  ORF Transcript_16153/g.38053 Transcript_16153/m.38053 type:complete len:239 (+) Transcript_16153:71-787(+)